MPEQERHVTFYSICEDCPEPRRAVSGAWLATVEVLLRPGVAATEGAACDWFSSLLSEEPDILDWGYVSALLPAALDVPDPYQEGDSLTHALSQRHYSEREQGKRSPTKRFLICLPLVGAVRTVRGDAAEVSEFLTDRALMDHDAAVLADFLANGALGDDVRVSSAVVIRQA